MNLQRAFARARKAHTLLYESTVDIYRVAAYTDDWDGTQIRDDVIAGHDLIHEGVPCHFSQATVYAPIIESTDMAIPIDYKIILDPAIDIRAGDQCYVHYPGRELPKYYAGKPDVYQAHQEVRLSTDTELT